MSPIGTEIQFLDTSVFAELYQEHHPRVLGLCRYMLGSPDEAEDAANDVFVRLPRAMTTYDRALPFPRWLASVTAHHCVDRLRRRRMELRIFERGNPQGREPAASAISASEELVSEEQKEAMRTALGRLPERYFVPLVMRYYCDLSYKDIAKTLSISVACVKSLVFRAKEELRGALANNGMASPAGK